MKSALSGLLLITALGLFGCEKDSMKGIPADVPGCIQDFIQIKQYTAVENPPASVWEYEYKGQTVYYIPPICCDIPSKLIDVNCNQTCSPDGGFSGQGDGKCPDFFRERTHERLIWKDERQ